MKKTKDVKKDQDPKVVILDTAKELFSVLEVEGDFEVIQADEGYEVVLETQESGIVIGYHGEVLEALQLLLSLMVSKKLGSFVRISLEVGDYKKNRINFLRTLATQTREKVITEGREFSLTNLKPWERRIVHTFLQDDDSVMSESIGEGKERVLVIKLK